MLHQPHAQANVRAYGYHTFSPPAMHSLAEASSPTPVGPRACWQLWEVRQAYFYQCCLRWLNGNQADAEDAFNTAALAVWRKTHEQTPTIINPMGWLTGVVRHACLDMHRRHQKETSYTIETDALDTETWADGPSSAPICRSPETVFLKREKCVYLHEEIAALPVRLRVPFALRCCEELTYEEISTQLGLAVPTVRKRVQEARTQLGRKLLKYLQGHTGPDLHVPWPDEQTLFTTPHVTVPTGSSDETATLQPRAVALAEVSKREEQKLCTLRAYVAAYPTGWKKRLALADQLCKMGYQEEAIVMYEQVLEKQPQLIGVWVQIGRIYQALGRGKNAVAMYEHALPLAGTAAMRDAIVGLIERVVTVAYE